MNGRRGLKRLCSVPYFRNQDLGVLICWSENVTSRKIQPSTHCVPGIPETKARHFKDSVKKTRSLHFLVLVFWVLASSSSRFLLSSSKVSTPSKWFCLCCSHLPTSRWRLRPCWIIQVEMGTVLRAEYDMRATSKSKKSILEIITEAISWHYN